MPSQNSMLIGIWLLGRLLQGIGVFCTTRSWRAIKKNRWRGSLEDCAARSAVTQPPSICVLLDSNTASRSETFARHGDHGLLETRANIAPQFLALGRSKHGIKLSILTQSSSKIGNVPLPYKCDFRGIFIGGNRGYLYKFRHGDVEKIRFIDTPVQCGIIEVSAS